MREAKKKKGGAVRFLPDPETSPPSSQNAQCHCAYFALVNDGPTTGVGMGGDGSSVNPSGGTGCCGNGTFCDLGGYFTADGTPLSSPSARAAAYAASTGQSDDEAALSAGWLKRYAFVYTLTYTNATAVLATVRPHLNAVLTVESGQAADQNGLSCSGEYTPTTARAHAVEGGETGGWRRRGARALSVRGSAVG